MCSISWLAARFSALACCLSRNTHKLFTHPIKSQLTSFLQTIKSLSYSFPEKKNYWGAAIQEHREMFTLTFWSCHGKLPSAFCHLEKCWPKCWQVNNEQENPTLTRITASFKYPLLVLANGFCGLDIQRAAGFRNLPQGTQRITWFCGIFQLVPCFMGWWIGWSAAPDGINFLCCFI